VNIGVIAPQGWKGEYDGWDPARAWARTVAVAQQAERLGFESVWLYDHFHTMPEPTDELTFESFTSLAALAALTCRVRLGHIVICNGFRNPALVAKMISSLDVISGGRMELGIGAGWKRDEWLAYGYGHAFPETRERLAALGDALEVISRMLAPGRFVRATYEGRYAGVEGAINVPKPLQQPRVPIMVGGNGPTMTWRLAARFADELNLDGLRPAELVDALPTIHGRCEEVSRDPKSLALSVNILSDRLGGAGSRRQDLLASYRELGVSRVMTFVPDAADSDDALEAFAEDCRSAGAELA
jgi:alkanesulfonate monooxygenase SsuD/methylene tetrahydromethanopterin reductase-like flavin-dependent oxidoreductase (luciferase family)